MTTTRHKALMCAAILGLSFVCSYELLEGWLWNGLVFGLMAVSCATMFVVQVGEERVAPLDFRYPWQWHVAHRRLLLQAIRSSRNWTWRVKR